MAVAVTGCAAPTDRDPFSATGEVIAMGGGNAGPARACFTCHGLRGEGDGQSAPRLAGLPAGYLQKQLEDYADGLRPDPTMQSVARALEADDRRRVSVYYASLAPGTADPAVREGGQGGIPALYHRGSASRGLPACADCHGALGEGLGPANPPLAGQPAAYLRDQMAQWRRGERRNDPRGVMLRISRRLTSAEVEGLARYAAGLAPGAARADGRPATSP